MTYELAKKLKEAGFKQESKPNDSDIAVSQGTDIENSESVRLPTLSELLEACGDRFTNLQLDDGIWYADGITGSILDHECEGKTPEEAVANLWFALRDTEQRYRRKR